MGLRSGLGPRPGDPLPDQEVPLTARVKRPHKVVSVRTFLLLLGTLIMLLICVIPLWDAARLLRDPTIVFFLGRRWPRCLVAACVSAIVGYMVMLVTFFKFSRPEYKTEQTVMMIGNIVVTALGLAMLVISQPLARESLAAHNDLFFHCDYGTQTQRLFEYAMVLQLLRAKPECAQLDSIQQCPGYQESQPYTGFLRTLERRYKCAGFCSELKGMSVAMNVTALGEPAANASQGAASVGDLPVSEPRFVEVVAASAVPTTAASTQGSVGLVSALHHMAARRVQQRHKDGGLGMLSTEHIASIMREESAMQIVPLSTVHQPGKIGGYPPTLFSKDNYQVSCEGQAARALKYKALDVARVLYIEGLALLFTTVAVSLVKLAGLCEGSLLHYLMGRQRQSAQGPKEVIL
uniref:Uncharacterized protein n=1 Tax=Pyrodinium bahamense TaxID=73915 RepID=A0A7S0F8X4_9DINO